MKGANRYCQRLVPGAVAAVLGVFCASNAAADIISSGGILTGVTPATIGSGANSFDATHSTLVTDGNPNTGQLFTTNFTDTQVAGSIGPTAISVNAHAQTFISAAQTGVQAPPPVPSSLT
jgi:hypothetical protein